MRRLRGPRPSVFRGPLRGRVLTGHGEAWGTGLCELHIQETIWEALPPGGVYYDVGANNGFFSLLAAARVGTDGAFFSFEPLPENGVSACELISAAVSDRVGRMTLYLVHDGSHATPSLLERSDCGRLDVATTTLDEFAAGHRQPDAVKIDVEGAEAMVLAGATRLMTGAAPPVFVIELHGPKQREACLGILHRHRCSEEARTPPVSRAQGFPIHVVAGPQRLVESSTFG
ncbi:MAG: FkbM family methyltransferase [Armatimonadota bacterium]